MDNKTQQAVELQRNFHTLFKEWQQETGLSIEGKTFSPDGIVNPEVWLDDTNKTKILFVLKETNRWCDICEYVVRKRKSGKAPKWQTWYNIVRWTYLLRHWHDQTFDEMWEKVKFIDEGKRIYNLSRVALINISKQPGGKSTDTNKLKAAFELNNHEFLSREIALCGHLDYIICCGKGVASCVSQCLGEIKLRNSEVAHYRFAKTDEGTLIIDFVHPQSRKKKKELFESLYNTIKTASLPRNIKQ